MMWKCLRMTAVWVLTVVVLAACSAQSEPTATFDSENQKEYGVNGMYLGQNIKEAMDILKPTKADFMDMVTRQSYTVEQMSQGAGDAVMGMLLVDQTQMMIKVHKGELTSIMLGGVPREDGQKFKTYRGLAMFDSAEQLEKLYGKGKGEPEVVFEGSKYTANFGLVDNQVAWFRFDRKSS
ncbi:hypothetical protein HP398_06770 [Brevibacillus sp. HB1.4B]|uniref:hypothetical protein n=1 Tax=unclassified Brevibacillus TaxID=2684853 RepID=UPI00156A8341|nr:MULTISPECIES: hypothetical protein [unclassified Brevibacillus]NRS16138.1 hypothetical protein [Brevibacillus sp. HB1.4B]NTU29298.1 hypothetical protein [Brevibacillus sp. HB1.1]